MSLLTIQDLNVTINDAPILKSVSLCVKPGEIVAITGESGSGKSMTALSVLSLLPTNAQISGHIHLDAVDLTRRSEAELCQIRGRDIGMVFQEPMTALNPVQTIGAQVAEALQIHMGISKTAALEQAKELLKRVGLAMPASRYPHELSGGQRQRVVIAIAVACQPKLLIADEPTTALDVTTQARILALLKDLVADLGMGLLLITHDLAVVAELADQIVVMKKGVVVESGPTQKLLSAMEHPYTRALFAASAHQVDLPPASPGTSLLTVTDVVRTYPVGPRTSLGARKTFQALKGVSLEIGQGERVGLVGESGCGKSTLTRAILGLEAVQQGKITLSGEPVYAGKRANVSVRRRMQVVFQDPYGSFNPRHRVERLITEPLYVVPERQSKEERRSLMDTALTDVGLKPSDADRYIHEFSGGQRQRLAIARALIIQPDLVIFDEAVSALDVSIRAQILDLLAELCRQRNFAYLFISHDLSVVKSITDRVLVMKEGQIVDEGRTSDVLTMSEHPYTRSLIEAVPVLPAF